MSIAVTEQAELTPLYEPPAGSAGVLLLRGHHDLPKSAILPQLDEKGWVVVKGAISREKAKSYVDEAYKWLEGFGKGFKADDRSTWHVKNMPAFSKGGLFNRHGSGHEQFVWDIRSEPGVIDVFAQIWGTNELFVSYDGVNVSLPYPSEELEGEISAPWPHVDQSPLRRFKHCVQGIVNLEENGPNDGGLMVLDGSFALFNEFFETHEHIKPPGGWTFRNSHQYTDEHLQWFFDRGCKWLKVEAGPGDVILWDSRTVHYGVEARGDTPRVATYVCYKPATGATNEIIKQRQDALRDCHNTTHDPLFGRITGSRVMGKLTDDEREKPLEPPVLSDRALQLAGVKAY